MDPKNMIGLIAVIIWAIGFFGWIGITLWNRKRPPKKVNATVVNKYKIDTATKIKGSLASPERCVVVFDINGKTRILFVSAFSYGGYRIGETGVLKYRGRQVVDFQ